MDGIGTLLFISDMLCLCALCCYLLKIFSHAFIYLKLCYCCSHTLWYCSAEVDRRETKLYLGQ